MMKFLPEETAKYRKFHWKTGALICLNMNLMQYNLRTFEVLVSGAVFVCHSFLASKVPTRASAQTH
jgi:hypothetical protein